MSDPRQSAAGWRNPAREGPGSVRSRLQEVLREVVRTLAEVERPPCSPGERQAAAWLAERLRMLYGVEVALEDEPSWGTFPPTATGLGALGMLAAALSCWMTSPCSSSGAPSGSGINP